MNDVENYNDIIFEKIKYIDENGVEFWYAREILDHMGSTELAANLFRATQTEDKLRREEVRGKENANNTHFEVGKVVRNTIKELGGTVPEAFSMLRPFS